jgi:hypothetical protein
LLDRILEKLGFGWIDNLAQPETKQDLEPDYILFANDAEKEAVINQDAARCYRAPIAILEAKKVNHGLSQISRSQQRYPHRGRDKLTLPKKEFQFDEVGYWSEVKLEIIKRYGSE